jgi:3-phosphoshikimate 1-carboxyvinyltransferase
MALPELIEIVPPAGPLRASVTVPGSKSITNRALILAALADGETTLRGALWSEDTQVMVECLQEIGFMVNVAPDPAEPCNRTLSVYGKGGRVPRGGPAGQPLDLFVGNAGTAARFLAALVCLGEGYYRLHGVGRMHERPQAALFEALRQLGYEVASPNHCLPAVIRGSGPRPGACHVSIAESSQFASALLLASRIGQWEVRVSDENVEESPYVVMTSRLLEVFPHAGGVFQVEPDASSGSYFWAAGQPTAPGRGAEAGSDALSVRVNHWPASGWQIDQRFPQVYSGLQSLQPRAGQPVCQVSRKSDLGDSIMTAIVIAPLLPNPVRFTDLGRLRLQECERVAALRSEMTKCGARIVEEGDTLTVYPSELHGAEIETYNDHRMAMCFAVLGLRVPGIRLRDPGCVRKTFPNFFQKLSLPAPGGLGIVIRDGSNGAALGQDGLFAD